MLTPLACRLLLYGAKPVQTRRWIGPSEVGPTGSQQARRRLAHERKKRGRFYSQQTARSCCTSRRRDVEWIGQLLDRATGLLKIEEAATACRLHVTKLTLRMAGPDVQAEL